METYIGGKNMKDKIKNKINSKDWKFHELLKLKNVAKTLSEELYHEVELKDQLELVWDINIGKDLTFGLLFKQTVIERLEGEVMKAFQDKFESATVNFTSNEKSQPMLPVEKPATLTDKYQSSNLEDLVQGKDVIVNENPSLEEKDGMVETRSGNIKVKRVG
jgi:hypothetical protein|tara:strand:- start:31 stop:516 length:486 start_codon:yes stop_codon:yes gene_type:complete